MLGYPEPIDHFRFVYFANLPTSDTSHDEAVMVGWGTRRAVSIIITGHRAFAIPQCVSRKPPRLYSK